VLVEHTSVFLVLVVGNLDGYLSFLYVLGALCACVCGRGVRQDR